MVRLNKVISIFMTMCLLMSLFITPTYAELKDLKEHWAEGIITEWEGKELISGYRDGTFKPDNSVTRAEFYTLINNVIGLQEHSISGFSDVKKSDWFYDVISKSKAAGIANGYADGSFKPYAPITREEVAVIIARIMEYEDVSTFINLNRFSDGSEVSEWAKVAVENVIQHGLLKGNSEGKLALTTNVTRGEAVTLLSRTFGVIHNKSARFGGTSKDDVEIIQQNVTIATQDVTLANMIIEGDLRVAEGVGEGEVYLDNVIVKGDIIVKGGGENSVYFNDVTVEGALVIKKVDGKIRIVASGKTEVKVTVLESGAILVEKELFGGGFETVEITADVVADSKIEFVGTFESVDIMAPNVNINVDKTTTIGTIKIQEKAVGAKITGEGQVNSVTVEANNVSVDTVGTVVKVADKITGVTSSGTAIEAGKETTTTVKPITPTTPTPTGSTGSTSGSGSTGGSGSSSGSGSSAESWTLDITKDTLVMTTGAAVTLNFTVTPTTSSAIIWVSSNEEVVTVDKGMVHSSSLPGEAIITATLADDVTVTDSCKITVKDNTSQTGQYKVTFVVGDDATPIADQIIPEGGKALRVWPERYGYHFYGWYLDDNYYDFETPVTEDIVLVARWELASEIDLDYYDARFAQGYPKMQMNDENEIIFIVKMAEASVENPAKVYIIGNSSNPSWVASSASVIHGHTGEDQTIFANFNKMLTITDTEEHKVEDTNMNMDYSEMIISAFVIDQSNVISEYPTVLTMTEEIAAELDSSAPRLYEALINDERNQVVLIANEKLQIKDTIDLIDFKFIGVDGITATNVTSDNSWPYHLIVDVSGFTNETVIEAISVRYEGDDIVDLSLDENALSNDNTRDLEELDRKFVTLNQSEDKSTLFFELGTGTQVVNNLVVKYGASFETAVVVEADFKGSWHSPTDCGGRIEILEMVPANGNFYIILDVVDNFGETMTINSSDVEVKTIADIEFGDAHYSLSNEALLWNVNTDIENTIYGCSFTVEINGVEIQGAGNTWTHNYEDTVYQIFLRKDINLYADIKEGDIVRIKYAPQHTESDIDDGIYNGAYQLAENTDWFNVTITE